MNMHTHTNTTMYLYMYLYLPVYIYMYLYVYLYMYVYIDIITQEQFKVPLLQSSSIPILGPPWALVEIPNKHCGTTGMVSSPPELENQPFMLGMVG